MSRISNAHTVSIAAAPTSALGQLAASMSSNTWAQLTGISNQNATLGDSGGATSSKIPYCNSMPWNPVAKRIEVTGQDHGTSSSGPQLKYYHDTTNTWQLIPDNPTGMTHGYNHSAIDNLTGDHYHAAYYNGGSAFLNVRRKLNGSDTTWTLLPVITRAGLEYAGIAIGACWWSGTLSLSGAGTSGNLLVFSPEGAVGYSDRGNVSCYNPTTNAWFYNNGTGRAPGSASNSYHAVAAYSTVKNVAVYGGGNSNTTKLWKFSSTGVVTAMTSAPVPVGASELGQGRFCEEPVSGNFLAYYNGQLWELNPDGTGTWTQLTNPPAAIPGPSPSATAPGRCVITPVTDYGVVVVTTQISLSSGRMDVYKR